MQTIASSSLTARPVAGLRSCAAPRPSLHHSNGVRQQHHQQQRAIVVTQVTELTAAEIKDFEAMDFEQDLVGSSAVLPSGNVKLRVRMRGYDIGILAKACEQIKLIAGMTGAKIAGPVMLPTKKRIYCVLRSPHVNKDAREHFEIRVHNRLIDVTGLSSQTVQALLEWVPPSGLEVETSIV